MISIFKRELAAYFNSALAWILMAGYLLVIGLVFVFVLSIYSERSALAASSPYGPGNLNVGDGIVLPVFQWMGYLLLFTLPVLTMRLISEESRSGTLEMLFTYPVTVTEIALGKFLGAMSVVLALMALSTSMFLVLSRFVGLEWKVIAGGYLGVFLIGCAFVSFGLWASSLTSSQMIAAAITYSGLLTSWLIVIADQSVEFLKETFGDLSVMSHLQKMAQGTLSTHHIVYYVAWTALFLFLTIRMLETRKGSG